MRVRVCMTVMGEHTVRVHGESEKKTKKRKTFWINSFEWRACECDIYENPVFFANSNAFNSPGWTRERARLHSASVDDRIYPFAFALGIRSCIITHRTQQQLNVNRCHAPPSTATAFQYANRVANILNIHKRVRARIHSFFSLGSTHRVERGATNNSHRRLMFCT